LAAGILIRRNSLKLGREHEGLRAVVLGILSTLLLFAIMMQIPEHIIDSIPGPLIPAIYTIIELNLPTVGRF